MVRMERREAAAPRTELRMAPGDLMTAFRSADDLRASLRRAALEPFADAIVCSSKPVLLFLRRQALDDSLPATSKIGGFPDLPEDFAWPTRPPYPDAARRAADALDFARTTAANWEPQVDGPLEPHQRRIPRAEVDRLAVAAEARGRAFASAFPLAFVGQIDLAALSERTGFPAEFPRAGVFSVFEDVTAEGVEGAPVLFHHDVPRDRLKRTPPPDRLVEHVDLCGGYGLGGVEPWAKLTLAETLEPFPALAVPHHWKSAFPAGSLDWERIWDWFQSGDGEYAPRAPAAEDESPDALQAGHFGDRLGGWPNPIQGDPETELDGVRITTPGRTPWRQLFAYGGEFYAGTRRMGSDGKGDGATYHLIDAGALGDRRFEAARWTYQMD